MLFVALIVLQLLSSGLNLMGANQHLSTAVWGLFLIGVMILRWGAGRRKRACPARAASRRQSVSMRSGVNRSGRLDMARP